MIKVGDTTMYETQFLITTIIIVTVLVIVIGYVLYENNTTRNLVRGPEQHRSFNNQMMIIIAVIMALLLLAFAAYKVIAVQQYTFKYSIEEYSGSYRVNVLSSDCVSFDVDEFSMEQVTGDYIKFKDFKQSQSESLTVEPGCTLAKKYRYKYDGKGFK